MTFKDFVDSFQLIMSLFLPGYVFAKTYNRIYQRTTEADGSFENTAVTSLVLSYLFRFPFHLVSRLIALSDVTITVLSIILSFAVALIAVKVTTKKVLKNALIKVGKTTGSESIWEDIFDINRGAKIRCYSLYKHEAVIIVGTVKYFEPCDDGECCIALENYSIKFIKTEKVYHPKTIKDATMYINTRNIHGLEVTYGE